MMSFSSFLMIDDGYYTDDDIDESGKFKDGESAFVFGRNFEFFSVDEKKSSFQKEGLMETYVVHGT